ncbi:fatty acid hydroxylase [Emticicia oligotrophica DSM 17448]|uniref:Fatty acid hydroxylase n=1 Tax=Emticicia oligotrophica (strain DSM 17448 / CIP 109782 / MTCC 6937 / GPTSA100-15) TaxID=929562 RepID=A0ABM5N761_EMTOG|nr:sterol desaturase family protein [Emticicia oligotrophica]AFK05344.1 fatty acid hydroxylase [Emticicia oligotrophica DSM 17448]
MFETIKNLTLEQLVIITSTPLYTVLILSEIIVSNYQHRHYYTIKDTITNLYLMILNGGLDLISRGITWGILAWIYQFHFVEVQNPILYWVLLFVAEDFLYYLLHFVDHYTRFFWASHVTHHSSEQFNLTVGFRSSVFQPLYRFIYFIPLSLLGFKVADMAVMYSITQIYGILVHTSYIPKFRKMPLKILEYVIVTPSQHRVHHASNIEYLDKNMGMCLSIWDRMFGTFQEEIDELPIRYGLTYPLEDRGPVNIVFHAWKDLWNDLKKPSSFMTKLKLLFMPPGWSPDGSTKTSKQLREELVSQKQNKIV